MSDENKIRYRNSYGYGGEQLRSFDVFGYTIAEEVGIKKVSDKFMTLICGSEQVSVSLNNNPNGITVDQFIDEFHRLHNLPNKGKNLHS